MTDSVRAIMEALNAKWMELYRQEKFDALAKMYTEDCRMYFPGNIVVRGREEFIEGMKKQSGSGVASLDLIIDDVLYETGSDMAIERSHFTMHDKGGKELERGKYMMIWKKIGDQWFLHHDTFNSDQPSQPKNIEEQLLDVLQKYRLYFRSGDLTSLATLATENSVHMLAGQPSVKGRQEFQAFNQALWNKGVKDFEVEKDTFYRLGEGLGALRVYLTTLDAGGKPLERNLFLMVFTKYEDGKWRIEVDLN